MKIVHVTSEAKASPIITALTRISADKNIDQGDSSRSAGAVDFSDLEPSAEVAPVSEAAGAWAVAIAADGARALAVGPALTRTPTRCHPPRPSLTATLRPQTTVPRLTLPT